ncbi:MAG: ATP-grasp domain-containing protein [Deltaproteobacteria bacterium]|nr:MAG: ATP-grasp domain-containing protein [Deltaproteobacteria bacterium]
MLVVFLNPVHPVEMQDFALGLREVGATVLGVGDTPKSALPRKAKEALSAYLQVPRLLDEDDVVRRTLDGLGGRRPERVETCWEPLVIAAARIREAVGASGMSVDTVRGFRDKQLMKERVAAVGVPVPQSLRVRTADQARAAAAEIGYPLILKPIDGAGSASTYRCDDPDELERALSRMGHVVEASCETFIDGQEFTYDTICVDGEPRYENVSQYLPRPLIARSQEWLSPIIVTYRDLSDPRLKPGVTMGRRVLAALGMERGYTHMEWYRTGAGEVVFGEIGCRPGGARLVDQMNVGSSADLFVEWARAVVHGQVQVGPDKPYLTAIIFKRAQGRGRIREVRGLVDFLREHGAHVAFEELLRPGTPRRDWTQALLSDGFLLLRHPDEDTLLALANKAAQDIQLFAS